MDRGAGITVQIWGEAWGEPPGKDEQMTRPSDRAEPGLDQPQASGG